MSWTKSQNRYHVGFGIFNIQTLISAEYGRSTFTGVKSDTSSTQPFVIIKADSEFTSTGVVGISYPPSQLYPAGIEFTSTGVVGISCLPAIILADSEFTSTGVVGISYPPAIINGRRSSTFTGVKFLECSAPSLSYLAGNGFTSTGVVGISCLPAILNMADSEFTSTGVVGISYPPAIINGRRSTKCAFTGVKFLECSAPADNISFRKIYE